MHTKLTRVLGCRINVRPSVTSCFWSVKYFQLTVKFAFLLCNLVKVDPTWKDAVEILICPKYLHVLAHYQTEKENKISTQGKNRQDPEFKVWFTCVAAGPSLSEFGAPATLICNTCNVSMTPHISGEKVGGCEGEKDAEYSRNKYVASNSAARTETILQRFCV